MSTVPVVHYEAPEGYGLDVELYRGSELRRRRDHTLRPIERLDFHVMLYLTEGGYRHMVDFEQIACGAGSVVIVQPGRVHRFGDVRRFQGWMVIFRSELLPPSLGRAELPPHCVLSPRARPAVSEALARMEQDAAAPAASLRNALLNAQLQTVLLRVVQADASSSSRNACIDRVVLERFQHYRALIEREHARWHSVRRYARALGCSDKSLHRATREVAGMTAKELLTARLVLEAKRRLAHTSEPVATIGDDLGFSEPTNFVKFFRRETGVTPGAFRHTQRLGD